MSQNELALVLRVLSFVLAGAGFLLVVGVPLGMLLRHLRFRRALMHLERMKAIEMATLSTLDPPMDGAKFVSGSFWMAFWMGAVFPTAAIWAAAWATSGMEALGYVLTVWSSVAVACIAGVVCATVILMSSRPEAAKMRTDKGEPLTADSSSHSLRSATSPG